MSEICPRDLATEDGREVLFGTGVPFFSLRNLQPGFDAGTRIEEIA